MKLPIKISSKSQQIPGWVPPAGEAGEPSRGFVPFGAAQLGSALQVTFLARSTWRKWWVWWDITNRNCDFVRFHEISLVWNMKISRNLIDGMFLYVSVFIYIYIIHIYIICGIWFNILLGLSLSVNSTLAQNFYPLVDGMTGWPHGLSPNSSEIESQAIWLVVWTPLKNISQLGWLFPIYGKIKHVPNHQPVHFPWSFLLRDDENEILPCTSCAQLGTAFKLPAFRVFAK